jgi:uncharacterized delta-60 repeat protein
VCRRPRLTRTQATLSLKNFSRVIAAAAISLFATAPAAHAQSPLDPAFGDGGAISPAAGSFQVADVVVPGTGPREGWIVSVGGRSTDCCLTPFVGIREPDGQAAAGGSVAKLPVPLVAGIGGQYLSEVDVAPDGKVVVIGRHATMNQSWTFAARYGLDGTLDTGSDSDPGVAFGPNGQGFVQLADGSSTSMDLRVIQSGSGAGDVIVALKDTLQRLSSSGQQLWARELRFGPPPSGTPAADNHRVSAIDLRADGDLVVVGHQTVSYSPISETENDYATTGVLRYGADGTQRMSFGNGGLASLPVVGPSASARLSIDDAGRPVVGRHGYVQSVARLVITRLTPTGDPDPAFGVNGSAQLPLSGGGAQSFYFWGGIDTRQNRVYGIGTAQLSGERSAAVAAFALRPDGSPDPALGSDGIAVADRPAQRVYGYEIALQDAGILGAGNWPYTAADPSGHALVRFRYDGGDDDDAGEGGGVAGVASSGRGIQVHKLISPRTRAKLAARGILALVSCELDCRALLQVRVSRRAADEMGLSSRVVASGSRRVDAGRKRWMVARLTGEARRALRTYTGGGNFKVNVRGVAP